MRGGEEDEELLGANVVVTALRGISLGYQLSVLLQRDAD